MTFDPVLQAFADARAYVGIVEDAALERQAQRCCAARVDRLSPDADPIAYIKRYLPSFRHTVRHGINR